MRDGWESVREGHGEETSASAGESVGDIIGLLRHGCLDVTIKI